MTPLLIICAACLAPVLLVWYIDKKDKYKHEPKKEIWKAFGYGVLVAIVCMFVEALMSVIGLVSSSPTSVGLSIWDAFIGAAFPEEAVKLLFLWLFIRKCKYFDENMDGIVYAVAIGMGFAAIENVGYLIGNLENWQGTAVVRSLFAVPCHYICAVIMGYYYSLAHFKGRTKDLCFMFLMPFLFHGVYDSFAFMMKVGGDTILLLLLLLLALIIYFMVRTGKIISAHLQRDLEEYILSITPPDIVYTNETEETEKENTPPLS